MNSANNRKAPDFLDHENDGSQGVDSWTSNGLGVYLSSTNTPEQQRAIDQINKELAEAKAELELSLSLARTQRSDINHCTEYTDAYVFTNKDDPLTIGGWPCPIVVIKDTHQVMHFQQYVDTRVMPNGSDIIREFEVE